jgi:aspartyl-tRNA(Asn)/glutamyl-tRNA(Gln) amidotransferase subunit A
MKSLIIELNEKIKSGQTSVADVYENAKKELHKIDSTNANLAYADQITNTELTDNVLSGIPYTLKDLVSTKGILTTGGSNILKNYYPPYSAYIYEKLISAGANLVCKANCDEYGMGGTGLHGLNGKVTNILDSNRITGGSSSGSVVEVASGAVPFSIGTDTGDSVRAPASLMGLVGYKPSYGLFSRYGVIPFSPSLDHVGIISKYVADAAIVAQCIAGYDERDYTSQKIEDTNFYKNLKTEETINICIIKDIENYMQEGCKEAYLKCLQELSAKYIVKEYTLDENILRALSPTYMAISYAEACSCHSNKTSIPFGVYAGGHGYDEVITKARSAGFGDQVKRRFTIGAYITKSENFEKIFQKAKKVRTIIINEFNAMIKHNDCLLLPAHSMVAPLISDVEGGNVPSE